MKLGNISFDGRSLRDFGVTRALLKNRYEVAEPVVDTEHVDGRNGDILFFNGDYENVDLEYLCICEGDFDTNFNGFKAWAYNHLGYRRLEDDAYPDEFRLATILKATSIAKYRDCFEITFNCKPQKFLRTGETAITYSESGVIFNPTEYKAKPLIKVSGTGKLTIGQTAMTVTKNDSFMMIDCERMDCYRDTENLNSDIELTTGDFFTIDEGQNAITISTGMSIEIEPRWWRL